MSRTSVDDLTKLLKSTHVHVADGELSFAGRQIKLNHEDDAKVVVDAIENCDNLRVLRLEGNTLGVEAAKVIGAALGKHRELQRAKWSDMFTGRLKTEIPPALKHLGAGVMSSGARLVELDLSDNAFGPIGVEGIADLLRSPSCCCLEELRLNNNGLGPNGGKMLASVLTEAISASSAAGYKFALKVFVSGRGRLENDGAIALSEVFKKMGSLEYVSMPQNGINPPGIMALAKAFALNPNLKHINLADNTCTVTGAEAMAEAIGNLKELEILNLESCLIRNGGALALAKALGDDFPHLQEVLCNYNEIGPSGAKALVEVVAQMEGVKCLQLDGNNLGDEGKELVRATLEAIDRPDLVPTLSEDEGSEEEDEGGDGDAVGDADEQSDEEDAGDGDGVVLDDSVLQVVGVGIMPSKPPSKVSSADFVASPTKEGIQGLDSSEWLSFCKQELSARLDEVERCEHLVYLCMKIACPLSGIVAAQDKTAAFKLCDLAFSAAGKLSSSQILVNAILVYLGLIKGENKRSSHVTDNLSGPLTLFNHIVQQSYFPKDGAKTLHFVLTQSEKKLEPFFQAKHQLLQTLFSLS